MFLSILCKKCLCRELTWKDGADSLGWRFGSLRLLCLVAVFPVALPAVASLYNLCCAFGVASQPSQLSGLSEHIFFCTINRCFLVALYPFIPAGCSFPVPSPWLERCLLPSRQRRLQAGPGRVFLHFSDQSGVKSLVLEMSQDDNVCLLMLLVGERRLSNQSCCSPRWESTQWTSFFSRRQEGHCSQRYNG